MDVDGYRRGYASERGELISKYDGKIMNEDIRGSEVIIGISYLF